LPDAGLSAHPLRACSPSPKPMLPRSAPSTSRTVNCRRRSSCAACSPASPTMRMRGPAPGPSPAGRRCRRPRPRPLDDPAKDDPDRRRPGALGGSRNATIKGTERERTACRKTIAPWFPCSSPFRQGSSYRKSAHFWPFRAAIGGLTEIIRFPLPPPKACRWQARELGGFLWLDQPFWLRPLMRTVPEGLLVPAVTP
jgi:hypothetical protein